MIQLFLKSTNNGLTAIYKATTSQDYETIAEVCHKMAAPCKHFQADDLYNTIKQLEDEAKNNRSWTEITKQIKLLESEINEVNKIITESLNV